MQNKLLSSAPLPHSFPSSRIASALMEAFIYVRNRVDYGNAINASSFPH